MQNTILQHHFKRIVADPLCRACLILCLLLFSGCLKQSPLLERGQVMLNAVEPDGSVVSVQTHVLRPAVPPPYPVVIDMHGCSGIVPLRHRALTKYLNDLGYAVIKPESFKSRGDSNICDDTLRITPQQRLAEVESAIRYALHSDDFSDNIFLMGMSHGGSTVMRVHHYQRPIFSKVNGIIAFYPYCLESVPSLIKDTLILIGELDDWTPAAYCQEMHIWEKNEYTLDLVVYPDTYHSFDVPNVQDIVYYGHRLSYNEAATADSRARLKDFLLRHSR